MVELSLMASAAFSPVLFNQEPGLCAAPKEFQALLPSHGKRQELLKSGCLQSPHLEYPRQSMKKDYNLPSRAVPMSEKPVLIDVQGYHSGGLPVATCCIALGSTPKKWVKNCGCRCLGRRMRLEVPDRRWQTQT